MAEKRDIIIVDTETTGLDWDTSYPFEVSWVKWDPEGPMVPKTFYLALSDRQIDEASEKALEVNGWDRRRLAGLVTNDALVLEFIEAVKGNTLMGANVRFDARMLEKIIGSEPWHHRLMDIEAYVAGTFGLGYMPGNSELRELIATVEQGDESAWEPTQPDHTSANDVRAVRDVFAWCLWLSDSSYPATHIHPSNMKLG